MKDPNLAGDILHQLANDYIKEKKRTRRWKIFFRLCLLVVLAAFILKVFDHKNTVGTFKPHASVIDIKGVIADDKDASADNIAQGIRKAFEDTGSIGIVLRINSPGGSPVQADYIYNEIMRLKAAHPKIKVYAVCTDLCASAAYYIAAAADQIYADPSSLVGSIGVIYDGFGFTGSLQKLGVDRRLITAGKYKGFMDPFSPLNPIETEKLHTILAIVHSQFIRDVQKGRGNRLRNDPDLFSGLFWTGTQAKHLGLIDGFGSPGYVVREVLKTKYIVDYTVKENPLSYLLGNFSTQLNQSLGMLLDHTQPKVRAQLG